MALPFIGPIIGLITGGGSSLKIGAVVVGAVGLGLAAIAAFNHYTGLQADLRAAIITQDQLNAEVASAKSKAAALEMQADFVAKDRDAALAEVAALTAIRDEQSAINNDLIRRIRSLSSKGVSRASKSEIDCIVRVYSDIFNRVLRGEGASGLGNPDGACNGAGSSGGNKSPASAGAP